jgi:3-deoxy-manno-octulosonate cytidylyltransferase (CMP-KDO synthetase)
MEVLGVIPARFGSTRFEGKVLADIAGKPMIQHVWERAKAARTLDDVIIACDDMRIIEAAKQFGAKAVMTSKDHACGTDRIIEAVGFMDVRIVINIQADEPLLHHTIINSVAQALLDDHKLTMATAAKKIDDPAQVNDPDVVKVVVDRNDYALYFSRAAIPYHPANSEIKEPVYLKHIGLYGYTKEFLFIYKNLPSSNLERAERLEQLRVLESGYRIKVVETKYDTIGVDRPEDLQKVSLLINTGGGL